jgi:hypothetical protein
MKDTQRCGGLQRSEQCIQRHGGWGGVGRIAATPIVNQINPRSICALSDASGAAEDPELNVVRNLRKASRPVHFFNRQTPVVKAPWIANAHHPLGFQKCDRNSNSEIPGGADPVESEDLERPWKSPSKGEDRGNRHRHHRDERRKDEKQVETVIAEPQAESTSCYKVHCSTARRIFSARAPIRLREGMILAAEKLLLVVVARSPGQYRADIQFLAPDLAHHVIRLHTFR